MVEYIPQRLDIVWLDFDPQKGKEMQNSPVLVISPLLYNAKVGLGLFMSITSQIKGYPFECVINNKHISGAILCDQVRSLDWRVRRAKYITSITQKEWDEVIGKFNTLIS